MADAAGRYCSDKQDGLGETAKPCILAGGLVDSGSEAGAVEVRGQREADVSMTSLEAAACIHWLVYCGEAHVAIPVMK